MPRTSSGSSSDACPSRTSTSTISAAWTSSAVSLPPSWQPQLRQRPQHRYRSRRRAVGRRGLPERPGRPGARQPCRAAASRRVHRGEPFGARADTARRPRTGHARDPAVQNLHRGSRDSMRRRLSAVRRGLGTTRATSRQGARPRLARYPTASECIRRRGCTEGILEPRPSGPQTPPQVPDRAVVDPASGSRDRAGSHQTRPPSIWSPSRPGCREPAQPHPHDSTALRISSTFQIRCASFAYKACRAPAVLTLVVVDVESGVHEESAKVLRLAPYSLHVRLSRSCGRRTAADGTDRDSTPSDGSSCRPP